MATKTKTPTKKTKTPTKKTKTPTKKTKTKTKTKKSATTSSSSDHALGELRAFGLAYPGAHTKSPWPGHLDLAVKDKTFAYLSIEGEPFQISVKLPSSHELAMMIPNAVPTPYGLGKAGWVTLPFPSGPVPVDLLKDFIDESYRAQAPKRLVAALPAAPSKR